MTSMANPNFGFGVGDTVIWTDPHTYEQVPAIVTAQDNEVFTLAAVVDGERIAAYLHECHVEPTTDEADKGTS